jgi:hypothetical protein
MMDFTSAIDRFRLLCRPEKDKKAFDAIIKTFFKIEKFNRTKRKIDAIQMKHWDLECLASSFKWYCIEYDLTPDQFQDIFDEGLMACWKTGKIKIPSYPVTKEEAL